MNQRLADRDTGVLTSGGSETTLDPRPMNQHLPATTRRQPANRNENAYQPIGTRTTTSQSEREQADRDVRVLTCGGREIWRVTTRRVG
jgi:hypothetical protein